MKYATWIWWSKKSFRNTSDRIVQINRYSSVNRNSVYNQMNDIWWIPIWFITQEYFHWPLSRWLRHTVPLFTASTQLPERMKYCKSVIRANFHHIYSTFFRKAFILFEPSKKLWCTTISEISSFPQELLLVTHWYDIISIKSRRIMTFSWFVYLNELLLKFYSAI